MCGGLTSQLKVRNDNPQGIIFDKTGEAIAAALRTKSVKDSEGPSNFVGNERRT